MIQYNNHEAYRSLKAICQQVMANEIYLSGRSSIVCKDPRWKVGSVLSRHYAQMHCCAKVSGSQHFLRTFRVGHREAILPIDQRSRNVLSGVVSSDRRLKLRCRGQVLQWQLPLKRTISQMRIRRRKSWAFSILMFEVINVPSSSSRASFRRQFFRYAIARSDCYLFMHKRWAGCGPTSAHSYLGAVSSLAAGKRNRRRVSRHGTIIATIGKAVSSGPSVLLLRGSVFVANNDPTVDVEFGRHWWLEECRQSFWSRRLI
jgi:hypothetical protein